MKKIQELIYNQIQRNKTTLEEVLQKCNIKKKSFHKMFLSKAIPLSYLIKISDVLKVPVSYFLSDCDDLFIKY